MLPNRFKQVEDLVLHPSEAQPGAREELMKLLLDEQDHLEEWLALAQEMCGLGGASSDLETGFYECLRSYDAVGVGQPITWRVLQGTFVLCCLVKSRTLFALAPRRFRRMEERCQRLARGAMCVTVGYGDERLVGGLFMSEIAWMARSVLDTGESWEGAGGEEEDGVIERWRFEAWCRAMGRTVV